MRFFFERTRYQLYLTMSHYYGICWAIEWYKKRAISRKRSCFNISFFVVHTIARLLFEILVTMLGSLFFLIHAVFIDICWYTLVTGTIHFFGFAAEYPVYGVMDAYMSWQDLEPRNKIPLDLFRFKGKLLFLSDRFLIFEADADESYYEELRLLKIVTSIDRSVHISGIDSIVCIYNTSPFATADENTSTIHLQIPYRGDIRFRSWLKYSVTICNENNVHNGLVNADTFGKMALAIRDSYNVWENRRHFSILNLVKSILIPLLPAILITASFRVTKWSFLEWIGDNEIEIFFGVVGSISLFRVLRQDAPIRYDRLSHVPERVEQVARLVTDSPNDASVESTAWHSCKTYGSVDCQIKNGMEALMLAFILVYERDGKLEAICLDRNLEYSEIQGENNGICEQERPNSKRTLLMRWTGEKSLSEIDSTVEEYNKKFDGIIPANVWLGRPFRHKDAKKDERLRLMFSKYNGETYEKRTKIRSGGTGELV